MSNSKSVSKVKQDTGITNFNTDISFNNKIEVSEVSDMVAVEIEDTLLQLSDDLKKEHEAVKKSRSEAETELKKLVNLLVDKQKPSKESKTLMTALKSFDSTGEYNFSISLDHINVDDGMITIVERVSNGNTNASIGHLHFKVEFSNKMDKLKAQLAEQSQELNSLCTDMESVMKELGDLPRLERRVRAKITKAQMAGEITDTKQVLEILSGMTTKPLPSKYINAEVVRRG